MHSFRRCGGCMAASRFARGEQSRAIALHSRALKHAELAHDSRAIGLAHYELALCYKQVGDSGIVRDHLTEAASALHAAGDRRHLALVHSLSAVLLAQPAAFDEATAGLRQGERLAMAIPADDVLAGDRPQPGERGADAPSPRSGARRSPSAVSRCTRSLGSGHGLAVALATLGQIFVQLGDLERAEQILTRTLEVRSPIQFHETTGAVFDTLAQIHLMRGSYERAGEYLRQASDAYGAYGTQTMRWYEWSLQGARRQARDQTTARTTKRSRWPMSWRRRRASRPPMRFRPTSPHAKRWSRPGASTMPSIGSRRASRGSIRRPRRRTGASSCASAALMREQGGRPQLAHHDFAQSANIFELLGERYQAALSQLALGRMAAAGGSRIGGRTQPRFGDDGVQDARCRAGPRRSRRPRATC